MRHSLKLMILTAGFLLVGMVLWMVRNSLNVLAHGPIEGNGFWVSYLALTFVTIIVAWVFGLTKKSLNLKNKFIRLGFVLLPVGPAWVLLIGSLFFYEGQCLNNPQLCWNSSGFGGDFMFKLLVLFVLGWFLTLMLLLLGGWGYSNIALEWARKQKKHMV